MRWACQQIQPLPVVRRARRTTLRGSQELPERRYAEVGGYEAAQGDEVSERIVITVPKFNPVRNAHERRNAAKVLRLMRHVWRRAIKSKPKP